MIFKKKAYQKHFIIIFSLLVYLSMVFAFTVSQVMQKGKYWKQILNSSITVELPINQNLQDSIDILRGVDDVKVVQAMEEDEKQEILNKWLDGVDISKMPIADIIRVKVSSDADIVAVKKEISDSIKGAKVYSNMDWGEDIYDMTKAIFSICVFLFVLILIVSITLINFMVKSLLKNYSREIDILHLNGASDIFISTMLQKNIFVQSVKASFLGVVLFHITWALLSYFFNISYVLNMSNLINAVLIILLVATISSVLVKINVEKELRL